MISILRIPFILLWFTREKRWWSDYSKRIELFFRWEQWCSLDRTTSK